MRLRRSMLYLPGNNPGMLQDAHIFGADAVLLDLEDSVVISEKDAARIMIKNALENIDYGEIEVTVRINPLDTDFAEKDINEIIPARPDALRLPKSESVKQIKKVDKLITKLEKENNIKNGTVKLMPMIETALGVKKAYDIAKASTRNVALTIGGEDLATDLGTKRTKGGEEIFTARSMVVMAAKAAGIDALDTVHSDVNDIKGLIESTKLAKKLGFSGKAVIHPKQIDPVHEVFTPDKGEVREARKIVNAAREAKEKGLGVITVNGNMIDTPIINRAERIIAQAEKVNK